ncbi:MAG TPA: CGNR zinc finger domain-containing protein [Propionibacteriaceae bacterium]
MTDAEPPRNLGLVRDFVNTSEPQVGTDQLVAATASACLSRLGLTAANDPVPAADLALLVGVREGLREVLLGHAGHEVRSSALTELDGLLRGVPVTYRFAVGSAPLSAVEDRVGHRVVAAVLSAVSVTTPQEWGRLKVCARDSCRWAFYDGSRNRSGRWCSMAGCGNIVKMRRAYRTRTATSSEPSGSGSA